MVRKFDLSELSTFDGLKAVISGFFRCNICKTLCCTHFLDRILTDISCDMHFISLSMPKETSYCLALYGRIPLWLEDMDTSSNAQIV